MPLDPRHHAPKYDGFWIGPLIVSASPVAEHLASWLSWSLLMLGEFQHRQDRLPVLGQGKRGMQKFRGGKECVAASSIESSNIAMVFAATRNGGI